MYHLTLFLLLVLGVDAIVPYTHQTHLSRRFHGHPQTLAVFPRSSHAMNSVDPPVNPNSRSFGHVQAHQLKREVTDRDWAHAASVETSSNRPERGVNYLSKTGPVPAGQPAQHIPVAKSSVDAAPASPPADPLSATSARQAKKKSHDGKAQQNYHKGDPKHHSGHSKKTMKKTMRL